jgi:MtN3 and saliva related transmembrane protein
MTVAHIIGMVAGFMTTVSFVPQVVKVYKTRHTKDLSLFMLLFFCTGVALWTAYGIVLAQLPIIIPNAVTLVLALFILVMKMKYK